MIAKYLIPEKDLGKGKSPGEHTIRGWVKRGDMEPQAVSDLRSQPDRMVLIGYLVGPAPNAKDLGTAEIDSPLGKLNCAGVTGDQDFPGGRGLLSINFENRLHEKAPFGIVSAVWRYGYKSNGQVAFVATTNLILAETNTTALTELPGRN